MPGMAYERKDAAAFHASVRALRTLREAKRIGIRDPEAAHSIADKALCDLLRDIGYKDVVFAFEAVRKY